MRSPLRTLHEKLKLSRNRYEEGKLHPDRKVGQKVITIARYEFLGDSPAAIEMPTSYEPVGVKELGVQAVLLTLYHPHFDPEMPYEAIEGLQGLQARLKDGIIKLDSTSPFEVQPALKDLVPTGAAYFAAEPPEETTKVDAESLLIVSEVTDENIARFYEQQLTGAGHR